MTVQQTPETAEDAIKQATETIAKHSGWFLGLGILLVVIGSLGIIFPFIATLAAEIFFGWLLFIGGIFRLVQAFRTGTWSGFFLSLLIAAVFVIAGILLLAQPLTGILSLTIVLIALFLADGVLETIMAFRLRPMPGWGWLLATGVISIAIAILIWMQLPSSALWALGLLVGIGLIANGWSLIMLALQAR